MLYLYKKGEIEVWDQTHLKDTSQIINAVRANQILRAHLGQTDGQTNQ